MWKNNRYDATHLSDNALFPESVEHIVRHTLSGKQASHKPRPQEPKAVSRCSGGRRRSSCRRRCRRCRLSNQRYRGSWGWGCAWSSAGSCGGSCARCHCHPVKVNTAGRNCVRPGKTKNRCEWETNSKGPTPRHRTMLEVIRELARLFGLQRAYEKVSNYSNLSKIIPSRPSSAGLFPQRDSIANPYPSTRFVSRLQ